MVFCMVCGLKDSVFLTKKGVLMIRTFAAAIKVGVALALVLGLSGTAWSVEDFYKGKTLRFIVGASPGGGYDTYTRAAARHISKHFPGNPTPVVQNLTGAGGLIVANYLYNKVKPDGLTAGVWNNVFLLHEALGSRRVNFKARKFGWVGAPVTGWPSCAVMGFTGIKTWEDLLKFKKPLKVGSSGGTGTDLPTILNIASGKELFDVVPGYKGTAIVRLALQGRELGGICMAFESMRVTARSMLDAKGDDKLIPILVHGSPPDKGSEGPAAGDGPGQGQGQRGDAQCLGGAVQFPAAGDAAAGHPQGPGGGLAQGLCRDSQGPGFSGGRQEVEAERRLRVRRGGRQVHGNDPVHVPGDQGTAQVDAAEVSVSMPA